MAKKKFKDTGLGKFLNKAGAAIKDNGADLAEIGIKIATKDYAGAIGSAMTMVRKEDTPEAKALQKELVDNQKHWEQELLNSVLEDVADAREMQEAALKQDDVFSKRFIYYFAAAIFAFVASLIIMMFFVEIPEENKRIVDMIIGVVVGTGFTQVLNFFFGTSKSSMDKTSLLSKAKSLF